MDIIETKSNETKTKKIILPDIIIDEDTAPLYCKREKFNLFDVQNHTIGHVNININVTQSCDYFEFVVHTSSKFKTEELGECGMSITSRVRPSLTTMEEKRREYNNHKASNTEYNLYLAKLRKNFYIASTYIDRGKKDFEPVERKYRTPISELYNFITEAANLLIIKNIAINKMCGKLKTRTLLMNGDICHSALIATQEELTLNKVVYDTTKVTRLIKVHINSSIQKLETWLNEKGHILLHKWNNTDITMVSDPEWNVDTGYISLNNSWDKDLQLTSIYLDKVERLHNSYATYLHDYPQAGQLMNDFVILLLMQKPSNVIKFAIDYFTSVGK